MNKLFSFNWQTNYLFIPLAMAIYFDLRYLATKVLDSKAKNGFLNTIIMFSGQMLNGAMLEAEHEQKRRDMNVMQMEYNK